MIIALGSLSGMLLIFVLLRSLAVAFVLLIWERFLILSKSLCLFLCVGKSAMPSVLESNGFI